MKKISEKTVSLLRSYLALTVMTEIEAGIYNKVVTEILKANQFKVDMSKVEDFEKDRYSSDYVILSPEDDALYSYMFDADIDKFKTDQKVAKIMNEDETSVHLCTETNARDTLHLFIESCLKDVGIENLLDGFISLEHYKELKELCIKMVVSYCKERKINLKIAS